MGTYVAGRRGNPSRLDLDRAAVGQLVAEAGLETPTKQDPEDEGEGDGDDHSPLQESGPVGPPLSAAAGSSQPHPTVRVFISHGRNREIVDQIKTMLDLADLDYEIAVEEEETAIPVPEKVFDAMRRCTSAVICVTADDDQRREDGTYTVNENVLIEIGAAFVLYEKRVVLVWDRRITVPSNLQGLYRSEFEGEDLSWGAGMKLMKAVGKFKRSGGARS